MCSCVSLVARVCEAARDTSKASFSSSFRHELDKERVPTMNTKYAYGVPLNCATSSVLDCDLTNMCTCMQGIGLLLEEAMMF